MNAIDRLIDAIGYPSGEVSPEKGAVTLRVDDGEMEVHEADGRIVFSRKLGSFDDAGMARLAGYAAGRILKEDAVLAWDPVAGGLMLWQDAPSVSSGGALKRVFEVFSASCDWWLARASEESAQEERVPEMMIRP